MGFDGPISNIIVDGNTVNDRNAFYSRSSCAEIYKAYDDAEPGAVAPAGEYFITRFWGPEGRRGGPLLPGDAGTARRERAQVQVHAHHEEHVLPLRVDRQRGTRR